MWSCGKNRNLRSTWIAKDIRLSITLAQTFLVVFIVPPKSRADLTSGIVVSKPQQRLWGAAKLAQSAGVFGQPASRPKWIPHIFVQDQLSIDGRMFRSTS